MTMIKENLNIKHNHISIEGHENYDKEKNTMAWILVWVFLVRDQ